MSDYKTIERELLGIGQAEMQNIVFQILLMLLMDTITKSKK